MIEATIFAALRLPSGVLHSLESGSITAIHAQSFNRPNQDFALCIDNSETSEVKISLWARCEKSQQFIEKNKCDFLAEHLQIPVKDLQNAIEANGFIWISYLRVYNLPSLVVIKNNAKGVFLALEKKIYINELKPILDDRDFARLKQQLLNLEPPEPLDTKIQKIIEKVELQHKIDSEKELDWIGQIGKVGNSCGGHEFEKLVRKSFIKLGFSNSNINPKASLDPEATGGAGGIDLCCEKPYPIVGECKASGNQSIPTTVCSQLTYLGQAHFPDYEKAIKIIIAAGHLNHHSNPIAIGSKMNVIRPETLEKLVKLKTSHVGSVNLLELKLCLESHPFGEDANSKLLDFMEKVEGNINLRSQIVQAVKELQETNPDWSSSREIRTQYNARNKNIILDVDTIRDILIELSSPLTGYLGRVEENGKKCDHFYFLRDLPS